MVNKMSTFNLPVCIWMNVCQHLWVTHRELKNLKQMRLVSKKIEKVASTILFYRIGSISSKTTLRQLQDSNLRFLVQEVIFAKKSIIQSEKRAEKIGRMFPNINVVHLLSDNCSVLNFVMTKMKFSCLVVSQESLNFISKMGRSFPSVKNLYIFHGSPHQFNLSLLFPNLKSLSLKPDSKIIELHDLPNLSYFTCSDLLSTDIYSSKLKTSFVKIKVPPKEHPKKVCDKLSLFDTNFIKRLSLDSRGYSISQIESFLAQKFPKLNHLTILVSDKFCREIFSFFLKNSPNLEILDYNMSRIYVRKSSKKLGSFLQGCQQVLPFWFHFVFRFRPLCLNYSA